MIDDDSEAAGLLSRYISTVPELRLIGVFPGAESALKLPDVADIVFADRSTILRHALDLLKSAPPYRHVYMSDTPGDAVFAFDQGAADFMLKPVSLSRFLKAVLRVVAREKNTETVSNGFYRYFNVNKKLVRVALHEILYIESVKEYVHIHTTGQTVITRYQLHDLETFLDDPNFLRVHRSFIVACDKVFSISADELEINDKTIPIGRSYQKEVKRKIFNHPDERILTLAKKR